jgi:hypothetical protein
LPLFHFSFFGTDCADDTVIFLLLNREGAKGAKGFLLLVHFDPGGGTPVKFATLRLCPPVKRKKKGLTGHVFHGAGSGSKYPSPRCPCQLNKRAALIIECLCSHKAARPVYPHGLQPGQTPGLHSAPGLLQWYGIPSVWCSHFDGRYHGVF